MSKIELVIFDMDGLMFDTEIVSKRAWKEAGKLYDYDISMEFALGLIGMNRNSIAKHFKENFGEEFPFEEIYMQHGKFIDKIIEEEGLGIKKGLVDILEFLEKNNIKKAVATSSSRDRAAKLLKLAGIYDKFDKIICGDEVTKGKPDPEIFLTACNKLEVAPDKAIVLEDSVRGLEAAVAGCIRCVLVPDLVEPSEEHVRKAYAKVADLIEVINLKELFEEI
ncbi:HAD family hydrolase [Clostridium manihotivorum]|uniref:HAD family phosphatase n=1 Tax=Clostridium manihotivorum TaxID=2320868 RepID=A0A3R5QXW1_9CLOT|nr:HAD family phosphatase [Clostridium manihotivorum]QAA34846.1 HAD family phosphatase [Clostridium manihotivorum]